MKLSTRTRQIVYRRSDNRCEMCGTPGVLHDHHRRPRQVGGSVDRVSDSPANILRIHYRCHLKVESQRQWAVDHGWIVAQGVDPATVPVLIRGEWVLLRHDGEVVPVDPSTRTA